MLALTFTQTDIDELNDLRFYHPDPIVMKRCETVYLKAKKLKTGQMREFSADSRLLFSVCCFIVVAPFDHGLKVFRQHHYWINMSKKTQTGQSDSPLGRDFYLADAVTVAQSLLGKRLVHHSREGTTVGIIVETEAYAGHQDAACHSYHRKAPVGGHRTNIMFNEGGYVYVYQIYGMYYCFNAVVNQADKPEAVLIRALEPVEGLLLMAKRRGIDISSNRHGDLKKLCSGPGKLCIAMGITREHYGQDLCKTVRGGGIMMTEGITVTGPDIAATPRINVNYAGEASAWPYRFVIRESGFLSARK